MTISWVSQGSRISGTVSPISVPCPASVTAGNLLLLMVENKYSGSSAPDTPSGWTQLSQRSGGNGASGNDSGSMYLTIFYKIADGSEGGTNVSVSYTGTINTSLCQIAQYSKTTGVWDLSSASGVDTVADTSWSVVTDTGGINVVAGDLVLGFGAFNGDLCTAVASEAMSQSGVTFGTMTERWDDRSSSGSDSGFFMAEFPVSSGSGTGELTFTATMTGTGTNTPTGPTVVVRLREAVVDTLLPPEYAQVDETYDAEHDYGGFTSWLMPEDVIILDQIWGELPQVDEIYDVVHDFDGYIQSPLAEDNEVAAGSAEIPEIDETYDVEHDFSGFVNWQVPENVEDFQPLAELPIFDETYDENAGLDFSGFVIWQAPENVEDFQALAELPVVDETYEEVHDYAGFIGWQFEDSAIQDFQALAELPVIDETYDAEHDYAGFAVWQTPSDIVVESLALPEFPVVDETYDEVHDYAGFSTWQTPENVEDFQTLAELPTVDETYDEYSGQDFSGFVFWLAPDDIENTLLGVTEFPQVDDNYDLYAEFFGWQTVILVEEPVVEEPLVIAELPQIDLYYEEYSDFTGWQRNAVLDEFLRLIQVNAIARTDTEMQARARMENETTNAISKTNVNATARAMTDGMNINSNSRNSISIDAEDVP